MKTYVFFIRCGDARIEWRMTTTRPGFGRGTTTEE